MFGIRLFDQDRRDRVACEIDDRGSPVKDPVSADRYRRRETGIPDRVKLSLARAQSSAAETSGRRPAG
jgi:hypothetical protein